RGVHECERREATEALLPQQVAVLLTLDARGVVQEQDDLVGELRERRVGERTALQDVARASRRVAAGEVGEDQLAFLLRLLAYRVVVGVPVGLLEDGLGELLVAPLDQLFLGRSLPLGSERHRERKRREQD